MRNLIHSNHKELNMGELIAYVRCSSVGQNPQRQIEMMKSLGVKEENIFEEIISGKNTERPKLQEMLRYIRKGDTVIVESYSRLARSTADLIRLVSEEFDKRGVAFRSLKENVDTTTPQGRLIFTIFAGLAQFERECILQRQAEGIAIAKREGKYKGRKPIAKPENWDVVMLEWKDKKITAREAMKKLNMSKGTFYRMVAKESSPNS